MTRFWFGVMMNRPACDLGHVAQPAQQGAARTVGDPAVLDEQAVVPLAVIALDPAGRIAGAVEDEGARRRQREAETALQLGLERGEPVPLDRVFQPRVLAVRAVAPVALHGHDLLA